MNSIIDKIKNAPLKQWIKASLWCLVYILFIVWVGNFWWLFLLPFFFDAFITKIIPWNFWEKFQNKTLYTIFSWIDAIIFALVVVYFVHNYLFQNYKIPTSSLEKTLLVGDHLFVSKASYGPRIPNTPLSMPLMQHTIPGTNIKSYIEKPQWEYRRLKGLATIQRNDIVVFNFPAGDTVAINMPNPDFYTLCHIYGRNRVTNDKQNFGNIVYRPVDHRECYVKRCVAIAGDTLQIIDNQLFVNSEKAENFDGIQHNYFIQTTGQRLTGDFFDKYNISKDDRVFLHKNSMQNIAGLGLDINLPTYHAPMTQAVADEIRSLPYIKTLLIESDIFGGDVYPLGNTFGWTRDNFGPIFIPKKGATITLNDSTLSIYRRAIENYEKNEIAVENGTIFINGVACQEYTFKMDYYWMMGDNRHKSSDSRYWGFVPEDHIIGRPVFIWLSLDKDKGWFDGKIRWDRFFKWAER